MGAHMKTTIELSDALLQSSKALAQQRKTTLRALMEEGLKRVLADSQRKAGPAFKLQDARVRGGKVLINDTQHWRELEADYVGARALKGGQ